MFKPLPEDLMKEIQEVAEPVTAWPIPEDRSTSLCCLPMVTFTWEMDRILKNLCKDSGIESPTHEEAVRCALHYEMDFKVDASGNLFIL